jgi:hypothetical protein
MSFCRDMMPAWELRAEVDRLTAEVETLRVLIEALKRALRDYEAEADAPTICEGATE